MDNEKLLNDFYTSFKDRDSAGMNRCYHPRAQFSDPIFQRLEAKEVCAMWQMLISRGKETKITFHGITADQKQGSCQWEAVYPYGPKKRMVHNRVTSRFEFEDGKIIRQVDDFDLTRWLGMAMGPVGKLLGWTPLLKAVVRRIAGKTLRDYMQSNPA